MKRQDGGKRLFIIVSVAFVVLLLWTFLFPALTQGDLTGTQETAQVQQEETDAEPLTFRNASLLSQHYEKHGIEMGFSSAEEYEAAAAAVVANPNALHKTEAEDGDDVYYVEETNEFVVVSTDGFIRTYFLPDAGISYFNRQ